MERKPLITVLMPCFNAEEFLKEALESILNQSYKNLEILCVNDGSTDKTGEILEDYAQKDSRIKVIHNKTNLKLIHSLNNGIELAQGVYIARMVSDDIALSNRIEKQLEYLIANPDIDIVSTGYYIINEKGDVIGKNIPRQHSTLANFFASFFFVPIGHPELLIKTNVLKRNHFLQEDYAIHTEDYELWSRLLRDGKKFGNIDDCLHCFRINSQSVSRKYTSIQDENFIQCARLHYLEYSQKDIPIEVLSILVNRINKTLILPDLKMALKGMREFKTLFIKKENIVDNIIIKEINIVYNTHLFDICFQSIKKATLGIKVFSIWVLFLNMNMFFDKEVLRYLRQKINLKLNTN